MLPLEASRLKENNSLQNSRSELHIEKFKMYLTFLFALKERTLEKMEEKQTQHSIFL